MKKPFIIAWLVLLAMLVPATVHAEDANVEKEPKLSLEASLSGDDANPVLTVRLTNIGEVPVIVDKELVYMLGISSWRVDDEEKLSRLEYIDSFHIPRAFEMEKRLLPLEPGKKLERQICLRKVYVQYLAVELFTMGDPDPESERGFLRYIGRWGIREDLRPTKIDIYYISSNDFVDYVETYVKNVDAAQLYRDKISLNITIPYEFPEETNADAETE